MKNTIALKVSQLETTGSLACLHRNNEKKIHPCQDLNCNSVIYEA